MQRKVEKGRRLELSPPHTVCGLQTYSELQLFLLLCLLRAGLKSVAHCAWFMGFLGIEPMVLCILPKCIFTFSFFFGDTVFLCSTGLEPAF